MRVGLVKVFADGGNLPAVSAPHGPGYTGLLDGDLPALVRETVALGYRVAVHAVGDAALQLTLDSFASAVRSRPDDDHRFRVEHGFVTHESQVAAMAVLGVVASVQPGVEALMGGYFDSFGSHVTPGRRADLVVVLAGELDPEHLPTDAQTWVAGTLVWDAGEGRGAQTSRSSGERVRGRSGHDRVAP